MSLGATMRTFAIDISDVDRGVYHSETIRVAQHPSETGVFMVTRLLAWALEWTDALQFGRGLAEPDEPSLSAHDALGRMMLWIDIGAPSADRMHRAMKQAEDVVIYSHRPREQVELELGRRAIHRREALRLQILPSELIEPLAESLDRKNAWSVLRTDGVLYVTVGETTIEAALPL